HLGGAGMVKRKCVITALVGLCLLLQNVKSSRAAGETNLGGVASSMQPGTWVELTGMTGFRSGEGSIFDDQTGSNFRSILEFADKAVWDTVSKQVLYYGGSHGGTVQRFVQYDDAANAWSSLPLPPPALLGSSHSYEHNAIDPVHRKYFYVERGSREVQV